MSGHNSFAAAEIPAMIQIFATISVTALWMCSVIGLIILTWVLIVRRFYSNMTCDQGYLSLTLPVSARSHMLSKVISGLAFQVLTYLVLIGGIVVMLFLVGEKEEVAEFGRVLHRIASEILSYYGIGQCLNMVLGMLKGLLMIYFSICVGQLFQKHKIWGAIGTYLGLRIVLELFVWIGAIVAGIFGDINILLWGFSRDSVLPSGLYALAQILVYFFVGSWILEKKANLD
jgi:hypothetical protein